MVQLEEVRRCNSALVENHPLVAVFVGGTSGIGEQAIRALAAAHSDKGKGLRLYMVGRNAEVAKNIISDCTRDCPDGIFRFVQVTDIALLKNVDKACAEIKKTEEDENSGTARVDLLVMSQALLNFAPRTETPEGLDIDMSRLYYSRMRFIVQLLPLLLASSLPAHIISIYAAGLEGKFILDDLSLRQPNHYNFLNCRSHAVHMKTLFMESLVSRHPGRLSFVHVFPSLVITDAFDKSQVPSWVKIVWRLMVPFLRLFSVSPPESGERMLSLASPRYPARDTVEPSGVAGATATDTAIAMGSDGIRGGGAYALNWDGEPIPSKKMHATYDKIRGDQVAIKVWDHTMNAFETIEAGSVFTD